MNRMWPSTAKVSSTFATGAITEFKSSSSEPRVEQSLSREIADEFRKLVVCIRATRPGHTATYLDFAFGGGNAINTFAGCRTSRISVNLSPVTVLMPSRLQTP